MNEPGARVEEGQGLAFRHDVATPIGRLILTERDGRIVAVDWRQDAAQAEDKPAPTPLLARAEEQLRAYFAKERQAFDLPLAPAGGRFHQQAWLRLCEIPWGATLTYGEMAQAVGGSARAIGAAMGANPIPILIPCHRVIAAKGRLGGYSGGKGLATKLFLLRHEGTLLL